MIYFDEPSHTYKLDDPINGQECISVTTLIGLFKSEFNEKYWSYYHALRKLRGEEKPQYKKFLWRVGYKSGEEQDKTEREYKEKLNELALASGYFPSDMELAQQEVLYEWKKKNKNSQIKGTKFHNYKENETYKDGGIEYEQIHINLAAQTEDLANLCHPTDTVFIPELRMYNREYLISGTSDKNVFYPNKQFDIDDWKGFPLDTKIPTVTGFSTIGELKIGDNIFDGNGIPTKVKNISNIHYNPCFKIKFDTGEEVITDYEHRWEVNNDKKDLSKVSILTTEEIFKALQNKKVVRIKCSSLQLSETDLPLDPYVLGYWLGDGNKHAGTITCLNQKVWKEFEKRGFQLSINHNRKNKTAESRTVYGVATQLRKLNLLKNKHIPEIYMRASHSQRLDLLRGFMDADGYFHRERKRCVMQTTQEWQRDAITELAFSLGFKPIIFEHKTTGFGKSDIQCWSICFSPTENPFLSRNEDYLDVMKTVNKEKSKYRYIKSVEKVETVPTKCLEVESESHTYLIGKNYLRTHNTNEEIKMENKYQKMHYPLQHLDDTNYNHYRLQISVYAWMLEQWGYTPRNLKFTHVELEEDGITIKKAIEYHSSYLKQDVENMLNYYRNNKQMLLAKYKK